MAHLDNASVGRAGTTVGATVGGWHGEAQRVDCPLHTSKAPYYEIRGLIAYGRAFSTGDKGGRHVSPLYSIQLFGPSTAGLCRAGLPGDGGDADDAGRVLLQCSAKSGADDTSSSSARGSS